MCGSNVVSLSGGKDSTAMLLMLLERGEDIADIVFFDTGWEHPEMYEHLDKLENFVGRKITRLQARLPIGIETEKTPFDWWFSEKPIRKRGTGQIHRIGCAWPNIFIRWCTGRKQAAIHSHILGLTHRQNVKLPLRNCIGFAADEVKRMTGITKCGGDYHVQRYPLHEWGITEKNALGYCLKLGFSWGGLYVHFSRVSCFCCPLRSLPELRTLRRKFPELWKKMLLMESWLPEGKRRQFKNTTVSGLDARFASEEA
jgi:hypothetical protein